MARGGRLALVALVLAAAASAHWETPDEVVAALRADENPSGWGVVGAERDPHAPRLLVVRVGPAWYRQAAGARVRRAEEWLARWRHSVPHGVLAVLDADSAVPVVRFGAGGTVAGVADRPAVHERRDTAP